MTQTQVLLLLFLILAVAVFAYTVGRNSLRSNATIEPPPSPAPRPVRPDDLARPAPPAAPIPAGRDNTDRPAPARVPHVARAPAATSARPLGVTSWGYQLQKPNIARIAESPFDLMVVDYTKDGDDETAFTSAELARLKVKPDGGRRLMIAYLSIGEAESYRGYWQAAWKKNKPSWLLKENPEWQENYAVSFWDPGWQALMCGSPQARLDRILSAGFDGVYLDKCDVFEDMRAHHMPEAKARPDLEADMVALITRLSGYAKAKNPDFLVIMQNTEALLDRPALRRILDGVAKEELVYGVDSLEKKNGRDEFTWSREQLDLMKRDGKLVLAVEYLNNPTKIEDAVRTVTGLGYPLYIADKSRELDKLHTPPAVA